MSAAHGPAIPLCDLQISYRELQPQIEEAIARVLAWLDKGNKALGADFPFVGQSHPNPE